MITQNFRRIAGYFVALSLCMALQMTGFVMILPMFAWRFEGFGFDMESLGVGAMAYAHTSTSDHVVFKDWIIAGDESFSTL